MISKTQEHNCSFCLLHDCDNHTFKTNTEEHQETSTDSTSRKWIEGIVFNLAKNGTPVNHSMIKEHFAKQQLNNPKISDEEIDSAINELETMTDKDFYNVFRDVDLLKLKGNI